MHPRIKGLYNTIEISSEDWDSDGTPCLVGKLTVNTVVRDVCEAIDAEEVVRRNIINYIYKDIREKLSRIVGENRGNMTWTTYDRLCGLIKDLDVGEEL